MPDVAATRIAVLHGPNLNLLGVRDPAVYGTATLDDVNGALTVLAGELGVVLEIAQYSAEGAIIDAIHGWRDGRIAGAVVNAAAYSHTSLAIADALTAVHVPYVEVHLSNVYAREPFRQHSMLAAGAIGVIAGFGVESYTLGLRALVSRLSRHA